MVSPFFHMPTAVSLGVIALLLGGSIAASFLKARRAPPQTVGDEATAP